MTGNYNLEKIPSSTCAAVGVLQRFQIASSDASRENQSSNCPSSIFQPIQEPHFGRGREACVQFENFTSRCVEVCFVLFFGGVGEDFGRMGLGRLRPRHGSIFWDSARVQNNGGETQQTRCNQFFFLLQAWHTGRRVMSHRECLPKNFSCVFRRGNGNILHKLRVTISRCCRIVLRTLRTKQSTSDQFLHGTKSWAAAIRLRGSARWITATGPWDQPSSAKDRFALFLGFCERSTASDC